MSKVQQTLLGLLRAHYGQQETEFDRLAAVITKGAKDPVMLRAMQDAIRNGISQRFDRESRSQIEREERARRERQSALERMVRNADVSKPEPASTGAEEPTDAGPKPQLLEELKPITFAELILDMKVAEQLEELALELEYRKQLDTLGLRARNRLLLWGTPGNGKTSSAVAMASTLGVKAYGVSMPDLLSSYINGTSQNLGALFKSIEPDAVVVLDELDSVGSKRQSGGSTDRSLNTTVNTLLTLLDRNTQGVLFATTNRPHDLDPALLRRFDEWIEIPSPTNDQKLELARRLALKFGIDPPDTLDCENFDAVTKRTLTVARRQAMQKILADNENQEAGSNGSKKDSPPK